MNASKAKRFLCLFLLWTCSFHEAQPRRHSRKRASLHPNFKAAKFVEDLAKLYAKDWLAVIAHELGHTLVARCFNDSPINIHVGNARRDKTKLFNKHNETPPITFHSPFPVTGWKNANDQFDSKLKRIAFYLAGPLSGAATYYLFNIFTMYQKYKKRSDEWTWKQLFKEAFLDADIYRYLARSLFPNKKNDGASILHQFFPRFDTHNFFYSATATVITNILIERAILSTLSKKTGDRKLVDKEIVKFGNRCLFSFANKSLGALFARRQDPSGSFSFRDTDFDESDFLNALSIIFIQSYFSSVKEVYGG